MSRKNREVMAANTFLQAELHVAESKLVKQEQQMQQQLTEVMQDQLHRLKAHPQTVSLENRSLLGRMEPVHQPKPHRKDYRFFSQKDEDIP